MWPNPQFPADLVTFTEEILNGIFHFLCSDACRFSFLNYHLIYYLGFNLFFSTYITFACLGIARNSKFYLKVIFIIYSEFRYYHSFEKLRIAAFGNSFFTPFQINHVSMDQCSLLISLENIKKAETFQCFWERKNKEHSYDMR